MSTDNNSSKWLVGCLIAGVVGLLLCGGGVAMIAFWGYRTAQRVAQEFGPQLQEQMKDLQFATEWQPPPPTAGPEDLFPVQIGEWTRVGHDESAAIPELAIARDGLHGTYEANGAKIDVYAYPVPLESQGKVFDDAVQAIDSAGYSTRSHANVDLGSYHWMTFSFDPPQRFGRMWWANDWLVVTMTDQPTVALESFEESYLRAIDVAEEPAAQDGASEAVPADAPESPGESESEPAAPESQPADAESEETVPAETTATE